MPYRATRIHARSPAQRRPILGTVLFGLVFRRGRANFSASYQAESSNGGQEARNDPLAVETVVAGEMDDPFESSLSVPTVSRLPRTDVAASMLPPFRRAYTRPTRNHRSGVSSLGGAALLRPAHPPAPRQPPRRDRPSP